MLRKKQALAFAAALIFVLALSVSCLFLTFKSEHHCTGAHCIVCQQIQSCRNLLELAAGGALVGLFKAIHHCAVSGGRGYSSRQVPFHSPVTMKVKLTN